ncbi:hypothetical protein CCZ01_01235 [Helicobacter monodelphidis]|uniref:hypothetical protein n=1 Tax=Helicobacter sp. 15-1451 TaxID=2004995 RepID=UPI000DCECD61|nr:hypothetical protein [Helicobacter sp. 15-1451]RAX58847.1 hypothetical protein CCZ01_01235 [Helicobacter sp. 15-1451]
MYSFIRPEKKSIFSKLTKIWGFYCILSVGIVSAYIAWIESEKIYMQYRIEESVAQKQTYQDQIAQVQAQLKGSNSDVLFAKRIDTQNNKVAKSISNLFDLTPDQITLSNIEMHKDMLVLKGVTPSKEIYSFLLEAPLRAIFHESRVDFYPLSSGWFNFVSVSKMIILDIDEEEKQ